MAYQARIHIAELQGKRNTSRRCAWRNAPGHLVRGTGMPASPASIEAGEPALKGAGIDSDKAALGGSAI